MVISIYRFLREYYGITLDAGIDISHSLAKKNFRCLKGCPFKYANNNPELVSNGKIIYVKDSFGCIFPYICPEIIQTACKDCEYTEKEKVENSEDDIKILEDLNKLSTHIVHELLSKYKDKPSFYKLIKRELICRGEYKKKNYKLRKEIVEMQFERGEYNDKYQRRREIKCKKS